MRIITDRDYKLYSNEKNMFIYDIKYYIEHLKDIFYNKTSCEIENCLKDLEEVPFFKKNKYIGKCIEPVQNNVDYNIHLNYNLSFKSWIKLIDEFIDFVKWSEKCFMYKNDDTKELYVEENSKSNDKILYFKNSDYKVKIKFESTKIGSKGNVALSFLNDQEDEYISIINIDIIRLFGKQMQNSFKFISSEKDFEFDDIDDALLLEKVTVDIDKAMKKIVDEIKRSILPTYFGIDNIEIDDYVYFPIN